MIIYIIRVMMMMTRLTTMVLLLLVPLVVAVVVSELVINGTAQAPKPRHHICSHHFNGP